MEDNSSLTKSAVSTSFFTILTVFLKIGAFTFGGGYVMLPIIQRELVNKRKWIESAEFYDILVLIQGLPGPVALNCAIMVGKKLCGIKGGAAAVIGIVTPSVVVILLLAAYLLPLVRETVYVEAAFYGIRPAVTALVAAAALNMGRDLIREKFSLLILALLFTVGLWLNLHPVVLLLAGGICGWFYYHKKAMSEQ